MLQDYDSIDGEEYIETPPDTDQYPSDLDEVIDEELPDSQSELEEDEEEEEQQEMIESEVEEEADLDESVDEGELEEGEVREPVVKRKQSQGLKGGKKLKTKHEEVENEEEPGDQREVVTSEEVMELQPSTSNDPEVTEAANVDYNAEGDIDTDDESDDGINVDLNYKAVARERKTTDGQSGVSTTQMEILELEMRARAIKAMLKATEIKEKRVRLVQKHKLTVKNTTEVVTKPKLKTVTNVQSNEAQGRKIVMSSKQSQDETKKDVDTRIVKKSPVISTFVNVKNNSSSSQKVAITKQTLPVSNQKQVSKKPVTTKASPTSSTDVKPIVSQSSSEKEEKAEAEPKSNSGKTVTSEAPSSGPGTSHDPNKKPLKRKLIRK